MAPGVANINSGSSSAFGGCLSPCERKGEMFSWQTNGNSHCGSAAIDSKLSPLQMNRQKWKPTIPRSLKGPVEIQTVESISATNKQYNMGVPEEDLQTLAKLFPNTWKQPYVNVVESTNMEMWSQHPPLRIGIVLSGGQAPGGHNVISGVYDYITRCHCQSQLFGFLGGPHGIFTHQYVQVDGPFMDKYRNQGGFDMIRSGRHKIETDEQKNNTVEICQKLDLHGLIVVGGDDSNTNAAILAEYFKSHGCKTCVIGCPKTIDGDLRNQFVEASFGFDTAVKTYAEFVGNLCEDVATSGKYYHFVRLMGRSASHITLECALQTRPNLTFIGEEVQANKTTLREIVSEVADMVIKRKEHGKNYGVVLLPEGLIEFIPEVGCLIGEINNLMAQPDASATAEAISPKLSAKSRDVFDMLPATIKQQLLLDRDPHGNVQVAMIATERLLILMVEAELEKRGIPDVSEFFHPQYHYFGYEGRCGLPSLFDSNYCYGLGHVAAGLVANGCTGCMAVMKGLGKSPEEWIPAGCPLTLMMNIEVRKGKPVPVIKKCLVELDQPLFQMFAKVRQEWKYRDLYRSPGPVQFDGPVAAISNNTIVPPTMEYLLPPMPTDFDLMQKRHHFARTMAQMSDLQRNRLLVSIPVNPILLHTRARSYPCVKIGAAMSGSVSATVNSYIPRLRELSKDSLCTVKVTDVGGGCLHQSATCAVARPVSKLVASQRMNGAGASGQPEVVMMSPEATDGITTPHMTSVLDKNGRGLVVGIVLTGQQAPGVANVLVGLYERLSINGGRLIGFYGAKGLLENKWLDITAEDVALTINQGGFNLLGRTPSVESSVATEEGIKIIGNTCETLKLDGLVMIGGCRTLTDCCTISEAFLVRGVKTRVIGVPCSQSNNMDSRFIESTIGFDSTSKCYSHLIGNLLTDAASATKYWYFVRLMGTDKSQIAVEAALQTHSNITLVSEALSADDKTIHDVVMDIADVICSRAERGKNFGTVLIPESIIGELPQMKGLLAELTEVLAGVTDWQKEKSAVLSELVDLNTTTNRYTAKMTRSLELFRTLPPFIRKQLIQPISMGRLELSKISSEEMLSQMVATEMQARKKSGAYSGSFSPVCFYFGYQGRSSLPSVFDSALGLSHGYLSGICVESGITGYATSMRGLCAAHTSWQPVPVPLAALIRQAGPDDMYISKGPMVLPDMVKLGGKSMTQLQKASRMWEQEDRFCNPGPLQFHGDAMYYYTRYLFDQQHDYSMMVEEVNEFLKYLQNLCSFGVDENTLKTTHNMLDMTKRQLKIIEN
eukprot:GHVS01101897.1.p1 GENE.GHVS01101897.1~~GHVS01101897.1.p1  ORF type:complete len:1287 (-),score=176.15 GHVS01101897.1:665-4525(-)